VLVRLLDAFDCAVRQDLDTRIVRLDHRRRPPRANSGSRPAADRPLRATSRRASTRRAGSPSRRGDRQTASCARASSREPAEGPRVSARSVARPDMIHFSCKKERIRSVMHARVNRNAVRGFGSEDGRYGWVSGQLGAVELPTVATVECLSHSSA
jgi:hypothetical protein